MGQSFTFMVRKVLDGFTIATFLIVFGGAATVYFQRGNIMKGVMEQVTEKLPELIQGSMPKVEIPKTTGNVLFN